MWQRYFIRPEQPGCCPSPTNGSLSVISQWKVMQQRNGHEHIIVTPSPAAGFFLLRSPHDRRRFKNVGSQLSRSRLPVFQWHRLRRRHRWAGVHRHALFGSLRWCRTGEVRRPATLPYKLTLTPPNRSHRHGGGQFQLPSKQVAQAKVESRPEEGKTTFVSTMVMNKEPLLQDHNDNAIAIGATLTHEMGHNLGMDHDDSSSCACSGDSCIMAAALR